MVFHGSVFSTAHHVRTITNRDSAVEVLVDGHSLSRQRVAPTGLVELPPLIANGDGVVFGHDTLGLVEKIQSRSLRPHRRNAVPRWLASTVNFWLKSAM